MITDTDVLALLCILLALAGAALAIYAWQEHMQTIAHRIRAEEQAMWADHFQAALDTCTVENARLLRLLTQRQPQPVSNQQSILTLPSHHVHPAQFNPN